MTAGDALKAVRQAGAAGQVVFGSHARERMKERSISTASVLNALARATRIRRSPDGLDRFEVEGPSLAGPSLTVAVALVDGVVVVTVWRNAR